MLVSVVTKLVSKAGIFYM